eukprot:3820724-Lingulodinium_polyedra.AAC.1
MVPFDGEVWHGHGVLAGAQWFQAGVIDPAGQLDGGNTSIVVAAGAVAVRSEECRCEGAGQAPAGGPCEGRPGAAIADPDGP